LSERIFIGQDAEKRFGAPSPLHGLIKNFQKSFGIVYIGFSHLISFSAAKSQAPTSVL
jgi:hypothetical protein